MAQPFETPISRRSLLRGAAVTGAGLGAIAVFGCRSDDGDPSSSPTSESSPASEASATASATSAPAAEAWVQLTFTDSPPARRDHSLTTTSSGLILLFGGRTGGTPLGDLWSFDPPSRTWRQLSGDGQGPPARFGHNAFFDLNGGRLVITMGQAGSTFFNDLWDFELNTMTWRQVSAPNAAPPRYGAGGAHDPQANRFYLSHGFTDAGRLDGTWALPLQSGQGWAQLAISGAAPVKRCLLRTAWIGDGRMLLFGGQADDVPFLGDMWILDTDAGVWSEQTPSTLPGPRNLFGAALDAAYGQWFIVGGNTPEGATGETWVYDTLAGAWRMLEASLPAGRHSTDAAIAGGRLYIFGGQDDSGDLNDTWMRALGS